MLLLLAFVSIYRLSVVVGIFSSHPELGSRHKPGGNRGTVIGVNCSCKYR